MMIKTKLLGAAAALLLSAGAAAAVPAVSHSDLNVRSGPGTEYGVVGVIQAGATVDVASCDGAWCQIAFDGGTGYASRSYLQMAAGAPSAGVVVQAPAYDPYDYDYGYSYGPGVSIYAGTTFRHRHDGWRQGWQGRPGGWQGRNAGTWQGRNWQGGDRQGGRIGAGLGRAPQPGMVDRNAGARVSAPAAMPRGPAPSAGAGARPGGGGPAGGVRDSGR